MPKVKRRSPDIIIRPMDAVKAFGVTVILFFLVFMILRFLSSRSEVLFQVTAKSDVIRFELIGQDATPYVIRLPQASVVYDDVEKDFQTVEHVLKGTASIALRGLNEVEARSSGSGRLTLSIRPLDVETSRVSIWDETGRVGIPTNDITILSSCSTSKSCEHFGDITFLIEARMMSVGDVPYTWNEPSTSGPQSFRQEGLLSGEIQALAIDGVYENRFVLSASPLTRGDVVELSRDVRGTVAFDYAEQKSGRFDVVAYIEDDAIPIRRGKGGYDFSVDSYTQIILRPFYQTFWAGFISLLVLGGFFISAAHFFSSLKRDEEIPEIKNKADRKLSKRSLDLPVDNSEPSSKQKGLPQ